MLIYNNLFQGKTAFYRAVGKFDQEDLVRIGAEICAKHRLHPSELIAEEEFILQISKVLSNRKSARK